MAALIVFLLNLAASLFKPKSQLEAENAALRQQLIVLQRKVRTRASSRQRIEALADRVSDGIENGWGHGDYLREYLNLTGTKFGCGIGACSACVVILDDSDGTSRTIHTCITSVDFFAGKSVRTIEGIPGNASLRLCRPPFLTILPSNAATARRDSSTKRAGRLYKLSEIRLAAMGQHHLAHRVAQLQQRREVRSRRHDRILDPDADGRPSRKPLVAAQHRSRSAENAGQDRQPSIRCHLEGAEIEAGQPGPAGECAFRKEDDVAALPRAQRSRPAASARLPADIVTLDEQDAQPAQERAGENLPGELPLGDDRRVRPAAPRRAPARPCSSND